MTKLYFSINKSSAETNICFRRNLSAVSNLTSIIPYNPPLILKLTWLTPRFLIDLQRQEKEDWWLTSAAKNLYQQDLNDQQQVEKHHSLQQQMTKCTSKHKFHTILITYRCVNSCERWIIENNGFDVSLPIVITTGVAKCFSSQTMVHWWPYDF